MNKLILSIEFFCSIIIGSIIYTYLYPKLYNLVNSYTKRSEDLNDKIDFINTMIMLCLLYIIIIIIGMITIGGTLMSFKKYKKYKK